MFHYYCNVMVEIFIINCNNLVFYDYNPRRFKNDEFDFF